MFVVDCILKYFNMIQSIAFLFFILLNMSNDLVKFLNWSNQTGIWQYLFIVKMMIDQQRNVKAVDDKGSIDSWND